MLFEHTHAKRSEDPNVCGRHKRFTRSFAEIQGLTVAVHDSSRVSLSKLEFTILHTGCFLTFQQEGASVDREPLSGRHRFIDAQGCKGRADQILEPDRCFAVL